MGRASDVTRGLGLGLAIGYFFDPERGRRRRAMARDKAVGGLHTVSDAIETTKRDVSQRARGVVAEVRSALGPGGVSDDVLIERVRARLGGTTSHPGAIAVSASDGRVVLAGPILAEEMDRTVREAASVRGVRSLVNRLRPQAEGGRNPELQGGTARRGPARWAFSQVRWSPTARLAAGATGGLVGLFGARTAGLGGAALAAAGATLLARAATNLELRRLIGIGAGTGAVLVQKTINVAAPISDVFALWSRYQDFPRFMAHVREVRPLGGGRAEWTVAGPGGIPLQWETVETAREPGRAIAWRTVGTAPVAHSGRVRFQDKGDGTTRIDVRLEYTPPAGALGHAVAILLGSDPKRAMDEDLVRMKSILEGDRPRATAEPFGASPLGASSR